MVAKEVTSAEKTKDYVWNHKTVASHGSARIAMPDKIFNLLKMYMKCIAMPYIISS